MQSTCVFSNSNSHRLIVSLFCFCHSILKHFPLSSTPLPHLPPTTTKRSIHRNNTGCHEHHKLPTITVTFPCPNSNCACLGMRERERDGYSTKSNVETIMGDFPVQIQIVCVGMRDREMDRNNNGRKREDI